MSKISPLKIGLDFHGVINVRPDYFASFCTEALKREHEIHIITGGPARNVAEKLALLKVPYSKIFAIQDYYAERGQITYYQDGSYHIPDHLWNEAKAEYCRRAEINLHIDDSFEYIKWFTTPYCHFQEKQDNCITENDLQVDFSAPPAAALNRIEQIIKTYF